MKKIVMAVILAMIAASCSYGEEPVTTNHENKIRLSLESSVEYCRGNRSDPGSHAPAWEPIWTVGQIYAPTLEHGSEVGSERLLAECASVRLQCQTKLREMIIHGDWKSYRLVNPEVIV